MAWISTNASIIGRMEWDHVGSSGWTTSRRSCRAYMIFRQGCSLHLWFCTCFHWHTHTRRHAWSVICLCPPVRTEGRLALQKSLMARLWHPLWTPGWTKGHIYFWSADVENGAAEIIDFPFFLTSSALFLLLVICLLLFSLLLFLPHHPDCLFSLLLVQPGFLLGAEEDLLVSGATSAPCITHENRAVVGANTSVQVVECKVQAGLPSLLMVFIFGNCGYSLVRAFVHTSKHNYGNEPLVQQAAQPISARSLHQNKIRIRHLTSNRARRS